MLKKTLLSFVLLTGFCVNFVISSPGLKNSNFRMQSPDQSSVQVTKQLDFFVGMGYYSPSLKNWNDAISDLNSALISDGGMNLQNFQWVNDGALYLDYTYIGLGEYTKQSSGVNSIGSGTINHLGFRYYLRKGLSLSLSISHFKADASNSYTASIQGIEDSWPFYGYEVSSNVTLSQEITIYPTMLSLNYNLPVNIMNNSLGLYVSGGVGFYFSSVVTDITNDYTFEHNKGNTNWDVLNINPGAVNSEIVSNIRANANPLGYNLSAGFNFGMGIFQLNFEVGYTYAVAKIKEKDWRFFTRKYTHAENFEGLNYNEVSEQWISMYQEERKYFIEMPEAAFDNLKIKELDYSGIILKGGIGLSF